MPWASAITIRADRSYAVKLVINPVRPVLGAHDRKEETGMAKYHARPSNQYRYEHYDPRF
jgi:hypothetical protein